MSPTLNPDQAFTAALCSIRYAMGRMSYINAEVTDLARALWPSLSTRARAVILTELNDAIERDQVEREGHNGDPGMAPRLGMDVDRAQWVALRNWMAARA